MKPLPIVFAAVSALLFVAGCTLKPTSPRASVDATPPGVRVEERNLAESKRAYYEQLKDRTAAIYQDRNLSSYAVAEAIAAQELGPPPTSATRETSFSSEDRRAAEQAQKRDKYKEDLEAAADEISSQRKP